jgi:tRNA(fMet)-specific endonuclease VapC
MSGKVLLDTNIVIALFAKEAVIQQRLAEVDEAFVSSIVLGELYYGAQKSSRVETNIARVNMFAAANAILVCNAATAQHYGAIKNHLRAKGYPVPENDIWIAATAKQHQLMLVTRDGHFQAVEGLLIEQW